MAARSSVTIPNSLFAESPAASEVGGGHDRPARAEYVELGMKAADTADGGACIEQQSQGADIAHAVGEIRKIELGDDLEGSRSWCEDPGERAGPESREWRILDRINERRRNRVTK